MRQLPANITVLSIVDLEMFSCTSRALWPDVLQLYAVMKLRICAMKVGTSFGLGKYAITREKPIMSGIDEISGLSLCDTHLMTKLIWYDKAISQPD